MYPLVRLFSGQFLYAIYSAEQVINLYGRNPFVNQVSFFKNRTSEPLTASLPGRNPFVNQVSFFQAISRYENEQEDRVAIPS